MNHMKNNYEEKNVTSSGRRRRRRTRIHYSTRYVLMYICMYVPCWCKVKNKKFSFLNEYGTKTLCVTE